MSRRSTACAQCAGGTGVGAGGTGVRAGATGVGAGGTRVGAGAMGAEARAREPARELHLPALSSKVFSYKRNNDTYFPSMRRH